MQLFESLKNAFNGMSARLKNILEERIGTVFARVGGAEKAGPEQPEAEPKDHRTDLSRLRFDVDPDNRMIRFGKRPGL